MNLEEKQETNKLTLISIYLFCLLVVFHSYLIYEQYQLKKGLTASYIHANKELEKHKRIQKLLSFEEIDGDHINKKEKTIHEKVTEKLLNSRLKSIKDLGVIAKWSSYSVMTFALLILLIKQLHLLYRIAVFSSVVYFLYFKGIFVVF